MKILTQLTILFAICLVGQLLAEWLPFPFPGSVISMIILLLLLLFKVLKPKHIAETSEFLLKNMASAKSMRITMKCSPTRMLM